MRGRPIKGKMNNSKCSDIRFALTNSHVYEGDIVCRYRRLLEDNSLKYLEDVPDEHHTDIRTWILEQKKKLVADRAAWGRRGGAYKAADEELGVPNSDQYMPIEPSVKGF